MSMMGARRLRRAARDAAEPEVAGRRIHGLWPTRGGAIALAVVGRAEIRAALDHPTWDAELGRARIVTFVPITAPRVIRTAARGARRVLSIPVARPLPDVADQVVEPKLVRRERADGRGPL